MNRIAPDYQDRVTFLAVASRSDLDTTANKADELFSADRIKWVYSEETWASWEVFGQPTTFLVTGDDIVVDGWFGEQPEDFIRDRLDELARLG